MKSKNKVETNLVIYLIYDFLRTKQNSFLRGFLGLPDKKMDNLGTSVSPKIEQLCNP